MVTTVAFVISGGGSGGGSSSGGARLSPAVVSAAHRGSSRRRGATHPHIDVAIVLAAMVLVGANVGANFGNFGSRLADAATALSMKMGRMDDTNRAKRGLKSIGMDDAGLR